MLFIAFKMDNIIQFNNLDLGKITQHRSGEVKFGEKMQTVPRGVSPFDFLTQCDAKFVLFGIPEDIGVRANNGRAGTASAWSYAIKSIANMQHNKFCKGDSVLVLGSLDVTNLMEESKSLNFNILEERKKLSSLVEKVDIEVAHLVKSIVSCGKIPIIIGGGHNNAYGNIKGTALAKGKAINAINFDAHSDFRILEGRHSGNGFSYAFEEGFLKNYFIFGLHESYTSKNVLKRLKSLQDRVKFNTYDEIEIRKEKVFEQEIYQALQFVKTESYGIEIDLDAVPFLASSAMTPTGFSIEKLRSFVYFFGNNNQASYLHICEGAPDLDSNEHAFMTGKMIAYLVSDFIKARIKA